MVRNSIDTVRNHILNQFSWQVWYQVWYQVGYQVWNHVNQVENGGVQAMDDLRW